MSSSSATTESAATIDPPQGWTDDEAHLGKDYYWTGRSNSLKGVLRTHYALEDAKPIWARNPEYGSVEFIFQAKPNNGDSEVHVYHWSGLEDTVVQFVEKSLQKVKESINMHGEGKGYLGGLKFIDLDE